MDDKYRHPSIGKLALMVEKEFELRIYASDMGHELRLCVSERYEPTLTPSPVPAGATSRHKGISIRKPYTLEKLIAALEVLKGELEQL